jgi:N-acetylglutamate synthase-like GNAT family acetyltransferase
VSGDETDFTIRPARAEDKATVLTFCERTYEWGDYVPLVWDDWLEDKQGQLLVATRDDKPVAVAKVTLSTPTQAWLQGLRVHPQYRQKGLAHQMLRYCLDVARRSGATVARLATSSRNEAVQKTTVRTGMRRIAAVWILAANAISPTATVATLRPLTPAQWQQVSARILGSATLTALGGLYGVWDWQELTPAELRTCLERGQVLGLFDTGSLVATALITEVNEQEKYLAVGYAEGDDSHVQRLAHALRGHAHSIGLERLGVCVPSGCRLERAFLNSGYEADTESKAEIWIYELHLKGTTP